MSRRVNSTQGSSFPSPAHPSLTNGLRKKQMLPPSPGNRIFSGPRQSFCWKRSRSGTKNIKGETGLLSKEKAHTPRRIEGRGARIHILLFSCEKHMVDFPRVDCLRNETHCFPLNLYYPYVLCIHQCKKKTSEYLFINICTHSLFWIFLQNTKMGSLRFRDFSLFEIK